MAYRPCDLLDNFIDEETAQFEAQFDIFESVLESVEKDIQPFFKAIKKFADTGDLDLNTLKITGEQLKFELDQENAGTQKDRTHNKMGTLTESNDENIEAVKIKKEKISGISETTSTEMSGSSTSLENVKKNMKIESHDMPAPTWVPPKKKTEKSSSRNTRTKGKKAAEAKARDSDVIVQSAVITTINLTETEDSDNEKAQKKESNTRRTKTVTRKQATDSGAETDTESIRSTRSKVRNNTEAAAGNVEVHETRSTRTKTLRKGKKDEGESFTSEAEETQLETRSTRTKTIRKEKESIQEPNGINPPNNNKENIDVGKQAAEDSVKSVVEESQPETRSTRTKTIKKEKGNTQEPSEINPPNNNHNKETADVETTRSTRTKTRKQMEQNIAKDPEMVKESVTSVEASKAKPKRDRDSPDNDANRNNRKKSKSNSPVSDDKANTTSQTVYEDACSTPAVPEKQLNSTFVTANPKSAALLNATVTVNPANTVVAVEHSKYNIFDKHSNNDIFTEDESTEEVKTPPKKVPTKKTTTEVLFSPYEKTTLKKKVEAFEKLQSGFENPVKPIVDGRNEKARVFTPSGLKFLPSSCSTTKISRLIHGQQHRACSSSNIVLSSKKDPHERQKKLLERDQALKKKEAMLLSQAEAKRKLNEEKQLKAQQQRKALEAEKMKQLKVQKQRELEREEQSQKLKQELERKRLAQKKKLQEVNAQQQISAEGTKSRPIYMTTEPPKLPTDDCYDSDDSAYKRVSPPRWCTAEKSKITQLTMLAAGEKIKNTLFCRHAQTPDLQEIFEAIDPRKLKRTSSMLWKKPPRYTMMPDLNETKFSDDEELYESD